MQSQKFKTPEVIKGEKYPYLLWSENKLNKAEVVSIVLVGHGSIEDHGPKDLLPVLDNEFSLYTDRLIGRNVVAVTIALPRYKNVDVQILEAPTFFSSDIPEDAIRADIEILRIIEQVRSKYEAIGYTLNDQISGIGISAGANLINRLSTIYPAKFDKVALLLAGSFMFPGEIYDGEKLNYPLGYGNLFSIFGEQDLDAYREIDQYVYVGGEDTNPGPIEYENRFRSAKFMKALDFVGSTTIERTEKYHQFLKQQGIECVLDIQDDVGHHVPDESLDKAVAFLDA